MKKHRAFACPAIAGLIVAGALCPMALSAPPGKPASSAHPPAPKAHLNDLAGLMRRCAPTVAPATLNAIMRTESGFNPWALNVNGNARLRRPPGNVTEAISWSRWLIERGYSVDMGLMQINSRNLERLNLTPSTVFDPCRNISAGATILAEQYGRAAQTHGPGNQALLEALSAYNTGNFRGGFRNGYVDRVMTNAYVVTLP